ncbi:MAG TPA: GNAT family N-acetyltransferase [Actinomycetota bacterium]|jgi:predicted acetyltransferase|nr:GNAT family N-acetyltransferase [Actinomycetota bacterium]
MSDLFFRTIVPDEVDDFFASLAVAFSDPRPDPEEVETDKKVVELDRTFAAFEDDRIVGCAGIYTQQMVVPGGARVPTAGVTMVGVLPTHRRRGILRELMVMMLDQAAERGESMASLFASQGAIYGRFGFGHAAHYLEFDIALDHLTWAEGTAPTGRVTLLARTEALPVMRQIYERAIQSRPAALEVDDTWMDVGFWESSKDDERVFYAIHEDDAGTPDAFAMYGIKHEWPRGLPSSEVKVKRFAATTPESSIGMWRYLCAIDLMARVKVDLRPVDEPLQWLVEEPRALRPHLEDGLFLRPVDVAAAWSARGYAGSGSLVVEVDDAFRPESAGTFLLEVDVGAGTCVRTDREPDLRCAANAVGSTYVGGVTWTTLAGAKRVFEVTPGALARADELFRCDVAPWPAFYF